MRQKLKALKTQIIELVVQFTTIPINTERLHNASAHFRKGNLQKHYVILKYKKYYE